MTEANLDHDGVVRNWLAHRSDTDSQDWFLVSKARHAMALALGVLPAADVLTQPFTCLTAVNPIFDAGHRPVYADVCAQTCAISSKTAAAAITTATTAIIAQHSFAPLVPVAELRERFPQLFLLEDSAHVLGTVSQVADVSIQSFGADKMLATGAGGAVWLNPQSRHPKIAELRRQLHNLDPATIKQGVARRLTRPLRAVSLRLGKPGAAAFDLISRLGFVDPAVAASEWFAKSAGAAHQIDHRSLQLIVQELENASAMFDHRRNLVKLYRDLLPASVFPQAFRSCAVAVRMPVILPSASAADQAFRQLQSESLVPGKWYRPLLFPGGDPQRYGLDLNQCPVASRLAARMINLPTAPYISDSAAKEIARVITDYVSERA